MAAISIRRSRLPPRSRSVSRRARACWASSMFVPRRVGPCRRLPAIDGATALALGDRELAERLARGLEPRYPIAGHALAAAGAALAEAHGDLETAAEGYSDVAQRWQSF